MKNMKSEHKNEIDKLKMENDAKLNEWNAKLKQKENEAEKEKLKTQKEVNTIRSEMESQKNKLLEA